jgi:hypothetical protein
MSYSFPPPAVSGSVACRIPLKRGLFSAAFNERPASPRPPMGGVRCPKCGKYNPGDHCPPDVGGCDYLPADALVKPPKGGWADANLGVERENSKAAWYIAAQKAIAEGRHPTGGLCPRKDCLPYDNGFGPIKGVKMVQQQRHAPYAKTSGK